MKKILSVLIILLFLSQIGYAGAGEYYNPDFGIAVKYPKEWSLFEDKSATMVQLAISPYSIRSVDDLKDASYIITVAMFKNYKGDVKSYIELDLNSMMSADKTFRIVENLNTTDINGRIWSRYKYQIGRLLTTKYVYKDTADSPLIVVTNEEYSYAAGKYTSEFEAIIRSIVFSGAEKERI